MQNLPIGIQTFQKVIDENYLYVDKTEHIHRLIVQGSVYFLSRPRRFGKSLLISTLNEIFEGNKKLFKGLWIDSTDYAWKKHPVVRIDFSKKKAENKDDLKSFILNQLKNIADKYGVTLERDKYDEAFDELLSKLSQINKAVVLIDEYDKPIIDTIENPVLAVELGEILKGFYTIIKACDEHIRFVLLTGVSKFSKAGVFSGLNNLKDISMDTRYSSLLGITGQEMVDSFKDYIDEFAKTEGISSTVLIKKITHWYNGFCFSLKCEKVFNPFSLLLLFDNVRFSNYWFESATPSFLIKLIQKKDFDLTGFDGVNINESAFSSYEIENLKIIPILFQTGYLTIAGYNKERMEYTLAYPNFEIKNSMTECLTEAYAFVEREFVHNYAWQLIDALQDHDFQTFFDTLRIFFANIPYDIQIKKEKYYQTIFYLIFSLIGLKVKAEVKTNKGRIDAVIIDKDVYIFEFKFNDSKEKALNQIKEKKYFEKYQGMDKKIYLFGVEFTDRNIGDWKVEICQ